MKASRGFTLIELMIAVMIVGILVGIAIPAYTGYVQRSKITEATSNLAKLRANMEQWYQDNRTYLNGAACGAAMPASTEVKSFSFSCAASANAYTITATGTGGMSGFSYAIDQSNNKMTASLPADWGVPPATCWATNKGGVC